jgi:hypothetical protein
VCDFCSDPKPIRTFACEDFEVAEGARSVGGWMACEPCAQLIEEAEWDALRLRALKHFREKYEGMPVDALNDFVVHSHSLFREHYRKGP